MQLVALTIPGGINTSLQIGDAVYYSSINPVGSSGFTASSSHITFIGTVTSIDLSQSKVFIAYDDQQIPIPPPLPSDGDYIMFGKNKAVNSSSLIGYYADVKFVNNRTDKVELFSVGSEVSESSKYIKDNYVISQYT